MEKNAKTYWDKKTIQPEEKKPKVTGERRQTKKISRQDKTDKMQHFKTMKKIYFLVEGDCTKTCQQPDDKKTTKKI